MIVPRRQGVRLSRVVGVLFLCVLCGLVGYGLGWSQGGYRIADVAQSRPSLAGELARLKAEYDEVRQQMTRLERSHAIDQEALRSARNTMAELDGTIASLESDLTFYRNIMAPSEVSKGLQVDQLSLRQVRGEGRYGFKLVLTQVGDNKSYISGVVAVNIIGARKGEQEVIPLRDLSQEVEDLGVRFRFRYFQDVEGTLTLPEDFEPYEIQVVAKAEGAKASQAERTFDWRQLTES
ncbi:hypothetical protein SAMN05216203_3406 [Marinobacter daqiaonensis]|uniref:Uncharacterized protein n=2 Tax=Marinobacter daqiaonensis TaxID=650891 RepID=A0A1I6JWT5_9GAMM|nr:hypothetical protein SAMN05216203_3406 [Marinobacter daqiaonensis]